MKINKDKLARIIEDMINELSSDPDFVIDMGASIGDFNGLQVQLTVTREFDDETHSNYNCIEEDTDENK